MNPNTPLILIDTHVHMYDCFELSSFLESAYTNCRNQAKIQQHHGPFLGVLLFTESAWDQWFQRIRSFADLNQTISQSMTTNWSFHRTDEDFTLFARSTEGAQLLIVAGRQIVTKEKFEVLALMTSQTFEDGKLIQKSIEAVKKSGGIPVIPWAFGKWWGTRGKILTQLMNSSDMHNVFLGDNSGRPGFLPYPPQFTLAEKQGIRIYPGSDPLPLASEFWRPCSVGLSLSGEVDKANPGASLSHILQNSRTPMTPYFQHESFCRFIRNQVALKMEKSFPSPS